MGEIAEGMLDGTFCECCGEYMDEEGYGSPRYCSPQCAADRGATYQRGFSFRPTGKIPCPTCGKRVAGEQGLRDHVRDKHPAAHARQVAGGM